MLPGPAALVIVDPSGHRRRVDLTATPFRIGRQADNHLILRDNRVSRVHACIIAEGARYAIEDLGSRHGTFVNGRRVVKQELHDADRIELGATDSYHLVFAEGGGLARLADQLDSQALSSPGVGAGLGKLRAILEVARTLQTSFSTQDVLVAVIDAALEVTGAERGFLLLRDGEDLEIRVARSAHRGAISADDLRVPRRVIRRALDSRRDLLSMNFDPYGNESVRPEHSIADLELRSVVCVPLVRIRAGSTETTSVLSASAETVGVLYMDSRAGSADLAGGNRELLQSLAIEASTVLENARLLEEERVKQRIEEELRVARAIQQNLLPRELPSSGWFRACGSSVPSHEIGGDYFDVFQTGADKWFAVEADVSGKGPSAALLASFLQGAFLTAGADMRSRMATLNRFLNHRTGGEKYATVFWCAVEASGNLEWINAAHCAPILIRGTQLEWLPATGMPVGLLETAVFDSATCRLTPGDKLVIYTDGITEARNGAGEFFGRRRLRELVRAHAGASCTGLHNSIHEAVQEFTGGESQGDDITLLVLEYASE